MEYIAKLIGMDVAVKNGKNVLVFSVSGLVAMTTHLGIGFGVALLLTKVLKLF